MHREGATGSESCGALWACSNDILDLRVARDVPGTELLAFLLRVRTGEMYVAMQHVSVSEIWIL